MRYDVQIKEQAVDDLKYLLRNEPKAYKKALQLIGELYDHPSTGTGHPEPLRGFGAERWSRRITLDKAVRYASCRRCPWGIPLRSMGCMPPDGGGQEWRSSVRCRWWLS